MYKSQHTAKLEEAVQGYFFGLNEQKYDEYEKYLKLRVRPLMEKLVEEEQIDLIEKVAKKGWFEKKQLDDFIKYAGEKHCLSSFAWLLNWKKEMYGFEDKDFSL